MLPEANDVKLHERFSQLSALANTGVLTTAEWIELEEHLSVCEACREMDQEFRLLDKQGMPALGAALACQRSQTDPDAQAMWKKVWDRIRTEEPECPSRFSLVHTIYAARHFAANPFTRAALAACLVAAVAFGAYRLGSMRASDAIRVQVSKAEARLQIVANDKRSVSNLLQSQTKDLLQARTQAKQDEEEVRILRSQLFAQDNRLKELIGSRSVTEDELRSALQQRDALSSRLQAAEKAAEVPRSELANIRAELDLAARRAALLESKVDDLSAVNRDQERKLGSQEEMLAADRDIRELMGTRNLYIADVFDVDSGGQTRKPFGRVFYTQSKSLIFYAFDLDRAPGVKNAAAAAFQVWGRKNSDQGRPLNLGILYQDSAANRRWVFRSEDTKQLAEINAVFVTVEPHGGNPSPTGKPLLIALLRREVNHP